MSLQVLRSEIQKKAWEKESAAAENPADSTPLYQERKNLEKKIQSPVTQRGKGQ
jgi:hypothetical protein